MGACHLRRWILHSMVGVVTHCAGRIDRGQRAGASGTRPDYGDGKRRGGDWLAIRHKGAYTLALR